MAIAVQAQRAQVADGGKTTPRTVDRLLDNGPPGVAEIGWNEIVPEQKVSRPDAKRFDVDRASMPKRLDRPNCVNAAEKASHPLQRPRVAELGCAAAAMRVQRKAESAEGVQRAL